MLTLITFVMLIYAFSIVYCSEQCNPNKYVRKKSFENSSVTDNKLWTTSGLGSRYECAKNCSNDEECVSFFYNTQTDVCTAHHFQYYSAEPSDPDVGAVYYSRLIDIQDCVDILCSDPTSPDGQYTINPLDGEGPFTVYCDMTTDGGGWTVIQRQIVNSVQPFSKYWHLYKAGFGDKDGSFWQGTEQISRLTTARESKLRVEMLDHEGQSGYATYSEFRVENVTTKFLLTVNGYDGNVGDAFGQHSGLKFTTKDNDNDPNLTANCAAQFPGGWWFAEDCRMTNLNGHHDDIREGRGIRWETWRNVSLKATEMKVRAVKHCIVNG